LRAKATEANIALNELKVVDCIAIHLLGEGSAANYHNANSYTKIIPINILFVYKNTELDDKQISIDTLIDSAEDTADMFHDRLIQSSVIIDLGEFEDYNCNPLESYKRFDAVLSGVLYTWNAPVSRINFYCAP